MTILVEALSLVFECGDASELQRRFAAEVSVTQVEMLVASTWGLCGEALGPQHGFRGVKKRG